jgi:hypothetical protein
MAVRLTVSWPDTGPAVTMNSEAAEPPGIVTNAGTVRSVVSLDNTTVYPPGGAGFDNIAVHTLVIPEPGLVGLHVRAESEGRAGKLRLAFRTPPFQRAVRVTFVAPLTRLEVAGNVAAIDCAGIVNSLPTAIAGLSLDSATVMPPSGAGPFKATMQMAVSPAFSVVGAQVRTEREGTVTVVAEVAETSSPEAVASTAVTAVTASDVIVMLEARRR